MFKNDAHRNLKDYFEINYFENERKSSQNYNIDQFQTIAIQLRMSPKQESYKQPTYTCNLAFSNNFEVSE